MTTADCRPEGKPSRWNSIGLGQDKRAIKVDISAIPCGTSSWGFWLGQR
jgi:hypothetical protein